MSEHHPKVASDRTRTRVFVVNSGVQMAGRTRWAAASNVRGTPGVASTRTVNCTLACAHSEQLNRFREAQYPYPGRTCALKLMHKRDQRLFLGVV